VPSVERGLQALRALAQEEATVRVIVELDTSFTPEGELRSETQVEEQQQEIEQVQEDLIESLPPTEGEAAPAETFESIPYVVLEVDAAGLEALAANPAVADIQEDVPSPPLLAESIPIIGADDAWAAGYTGAGQVVAILDTGVDENHDFLAGKVVAEACFSTTATATTYTSSSLCPSPDGSGDQIGDGSGVNCPVGISGCSHGTHVAGIAAGKGAASGVAKDADIIAIQVFSRFDGSLCSTYGMSSPCVLSWTSDQLAALDWLYAQKDIYDLAAANFSLGGGHSSSACDNDARKAPIDNLRSVGVATVAAAGNEAYRDELASPACISTVVSVGATTDADTIAAYSNLAPFLSLLAPGSLIESSVPGGGFGSMTGTSMAAPHVAGAFAVLKALKPDAAVDELLNVLVSTGRPISRGFPDGTTVGPFSRIQLDAAVATLVPPPPTPPPQAEVGSKVWYLAEGYTGSGFETYILIQNPNADPATVQVSYMLQGGGTVVSQRTVAAHTRDTIVASEATEVGPNQAFSVRVDSNVRVIVERAMYYPNGGHATMGVTTPARRWYLAEGYTGPGFETFILIQNPNPEDALVDLTYMLPGGGTVTTHRSVPGYSRETVFANESTEVGPDAAFSVRIDSDRPIVVERAMYYPNGAHSSTAVESPAPTWYLAEGYTGAGFETFVLVQNPNPLPAEVTVSYLLQGGGVISTSHSLPANSRSTVYANHPSEVGSDRAFSITVSGSLPIIVERAVYFPTGSHGVTGVREPSTSWYMAEGFTGGGATTYILVANPNDSAAALTITYMVQGGGEIVTQRVVGGNSRDTIATQDPLEVGLDQAFSTRVVADNPVVVERAMYFGNGGHAAFGMSVD
jgi:hypothetical protein